MLDVDIIKEYGDARVENAHLKDKVKSLEDEIKKLKESSISLDDLRKYLSIKDKGIENV